LQWWRAVGNTGSFDNSSGQALAFGNGNLYVAGGTHYPYTDSTTQYAALWAYDSSGNPLFAVQDTTTPGGNFQAVTALGGALYAVGSSSPGSGTQNYLIEKFDASGHVLWRTNPDGTSTSVLTGVVAVGNELFAAGYTNSGGANRAVVLEIDPTSGSILSQTLYGDGSLGAQAHGIATDGTNLYVVGEQSSAQGGCNVMLLRCTVAGPATHFRVSAPAHTVAGTALSITVTALDASGQTVNGYCGTVHFTSSDKRAALPADYTFTAVDTGTHTFTVALVTAGARTVTAADRAVASITGQSSTITVSPAALDHLKVTGPTAGTAGAPFSITVTAQDAFNNTVTTYTGRVHFTSTDPQAVLPPDYTFTSANKGVHTFSKAVTLKTAGPQSDSAADTVTTTVSGRARVTVAAAQAQTLLLTAPSGVTHGVAFVFTVTARDAYGNVATGYTGTVHFSTSDAAASLPADYTFTAGDAGAVTFSAILESTGSQWLTVSDTLIDGLGGTDGDIQVS
jgi:hypothetical protein